MIAKFHWTVLVICNHSGDGKPPSYSQINTVACCLVFLNSLYELALTFFFFFFFKFADINFVVCLFGALRINIKYIFLSAQYACRN